ATSTSTFPGTRWPSTRWRRRTPFRERRRCSTAFLIVSCSGPTRWRRREQRSITASTTCGSRSGGCSRPRPPPRCEGGTTSAFSTRRAGAFANGNAPTCTEQEQGSEGRNGKTLVAHIVGRRCPSHSGWRVLAVGATSRGQSTDRRERRLRAVQDADRGEKRRLHSGAGEGGSESVRHRAGDDGRQVVLRR